MLLSNLSKSYVDRSKLFHSYPKIFAHSHGPEKMKTQDKTCQWLRERGVSVSLLDSYVMRCEDHRHIGHGTVERMGGTEVKSSHFVAPCMSSAVFPTERQMLPSPKYHWKKHLSTWDHSNFMSRSIIMKQSHAWKDAWENETAHFIIIVKKDHISNNYNFCFGNLVLSLFYVNKILKIPLSHIRGNRNRLGLFFLLFHPLLSGEK